jgi:putative FmdB family regulatory protein
MPIYEYRCTKCGSEFELKRPFSEVHVPAPCARCGGSSEKLVSGFGSQVGHYIRATRATFRQSNGNKSPENA